MNAPVRIAELAAILHPRSSRWRAMAMLTRLTKGFFDASRTQVQAGAYVIGGYVARESFWTDFETEWNANLDYWQINDFHLTDCLGGGPGYRRPGFDRHKRQLCALSFGQIINRRKPVAIWAGLLDEEWQEFEASDAFRSHYALKLAALTDR